MANFFGGIGTAAETMGITAPRVTFSAQDKAIAGTVLGAAVGFAAGGPVGAMAGASIGGGIGGAIASQQTQEENLADAQRAAEKARRDQLTKEFGAKQQAESMALANLSRSGSSKTGGVANAPGFIGSNISTAGTF